MLRIRGLVQYPRMKRRPVPPLDPDPLRIYVAWSPSEKEMLRMLWQKLSVQEIAERLKRVPRAVTHMASLMQLERKQA